MNLPKEFTTVTTMTKILALVLFVTFPLFGFLLGMSYQAMVSGGKDQILGPTTPPEQVGCTMDAKICPDGTAVGRMPPSCEFAPCPQLSPSQTQIQTVFCPPETKVCPNGTVVNMIPPACQFEDCPSELSQQPPFEGDVSPTIAGLCVGEGEESSYLSNRSMCCEGLTAISTGKMIPNYICEPVSGNRFICTRCGDGLCGIGENECNCRSDC